MQKTINNICFNYTATIKLFLASHLPSNMRALVRFELYSTIKETKPLLCLRINKAGKEL